MFWTVWGQSLNEFWTCWMVFGFGGVLMESINTNPGYDTNQKGTWRKLAKVDHIFINNPVINWEFSMSTSIRCEKRRERAKEEINGRSLLAQKKLLF